MVSVYVYLRVNVNAFVYAYMNPFLKLVLVNRLCTCMGKRLCMCILSVCMHMCMYLRCVRVWVNVCVCIYGECTCKYVYRLCMCMGKCVCMCIWTVYMHVCMFTYMQMCMHTGIRFGSSYVLISCVRVWVNVCVCVSC